MGVRSVFETPYERGGVIVPGLPILPHGVERHPVPGGGSRAVRIDRGDEIWVVDREGLQTAELVFFTPDGRSDAAMIGLEGDGGATGLQAVLSSGDASGRRVLRGLEKSGFDIGRADAARVLGEGSRPGDSVTLAAGADGLLIVCAPGGPMAPEAQDPPTEIILYVRRANPGEAKGGRAPPEPLADPLADLNIQPGNATSYEVKAGQFIQILDVQGRECGRELAAPAGSPAPGASFGGSTVPA